MSPFRLVLDATPLLGTRTGIGRYVEQLVASLPEAIEAAGLDAHLEVTTWSARRHRVPGLPAGVRQVGPRVPARALRAAWLRSDLPPIEALVGRVDLVHGTNFVCPPARKAAQVVTVHDLTYLEHQDTVHRSSLDYRTLVPRALDRGALVLAISETVGAAVRETYGLPADRVVVTALGVGSEWFTATPPAAGWLAERGLPGRYLVFVGSLDPRKNLGRLLAAHAAARAAAPSEVPDLVLAGPAGRSDVAAQPGVHLAGWLPDDELRALVAGAAGLVLVSLDEGFGLTVLEALACGVPVLAADVPTLREVGGDQVLLVPPTDVEAIADGLLRLPSGPGTQASRRQWAGRWTWQACAAATVEAYRRSLEG